MSGDAAEATSANGTLADSTLVDGTVDQGAVFDTQATEAMALAYERICEALGFGVQANPDMSKAIADQIVDLARRGERDPEQLYAWAMLALIADAKPST